MVDLHERLEAAAARPGRDAPLAQVEQRLRARRRTRVGGVVVASLLCLGIVGGGIALATNGGSGNVSTIPTGQSVTVNGVTAELPVGWVDLSEAQTEGIYRGMLFAAGTTTVIDVGPCAVAQATSEDAFVTLEDASSRYVEPALEILPKPEDFATAPARESSCTDDNVGLISRNYEYMFSDAPRDRALVASVILGPNASPESRAEAYAILNSIELGDVIAPIPTLSPTVAPLPPTTVPPSSETQAVQDVFLGWINTQPRDAVGPFVEDWESIKDAVMQAAATAPLPLDGYTGRVDAILAITDTEADVIYSFLNGGAVAVGNLRGHAVKVDGIWKVSRETVCAAIEIGGVTCPPRTG